MKDRQSEHKRDPHYKMAKMEGFRARSAYKLLDIQKKFNIFKRAFYILDLGSAPGSWLQVAKQFAERNLSLYNDQHYHKGYYKIMGVDIKKIAPIENVKILKMDFSITEFQKEVEIFFAGKVDLIMSDAAVNKTGIKFNDHMNQIRLSYNILDIARNNLKNKGNLILKVFQGQESHDFINAMNEDFNFVKTYKPQSSKKQSNEMYLIALNKKQSQS
jgi:23S rRNA (uridine2552-2'-O)-methyltransferase